MKNFTFCKVDSDNEPKGLPNDFNDEREVREQPNEMDEDEFEVPDEIIDRAYRDNVDFGDTDKNHFLDSDF